MPDFLQVSHPYRSWAMAWADAESRVVEAMVGAERETAMHLATNLQERMVAHEGTGSPEDAPGWQQAPHLAAHVAVFEHQGTTAVGIPPGEESEEAFIYEYGDDVSAPQPILRSTLSTSYEQLSEYLGQSFQRRLFGAPGPE